MNTLSASLVYSQLALTIEWYVGSDAELALDGPGLQRIVMLMSSNLADKLEKYGIDYVDAMDRFGDNADLFKRLALRYLDDTHFVSMEAAMEVGDYDDAYAHAHALKGVAGNLSFKNLYTAASMICEALRHGEPEAAKGYMPSCKEAQEAVIAGLTAWQTDTL